MGRGGGYLIPRFSPQKWGFERESGDKAREGGSGLESMQCKRLYTTLYIVKIIVFLVYSLPVM